MKHIITTIAFCLALGLMPLALGMSLNEVIDTKGQEIQVGDGFIHYTLENQKIRIFFLDKDKKLLKPKWTSGFLQVRYISSRTKADIPYTMPLLQEKNMYLETARILKPPFNYKIFISFINPQNPHVPITIEPLRLTGESFSKLNENIK